MPAEAGIQKYPKRLDSCLRRNDRGVRQLQLLLVIPAKAGIQKRQDGTVAFENRDIK